MSNKTFLKSINSIPSPQKITPKQHEFARLIAEEHLTSSDAYRRAYKPNVLAKNKSVHEMACRVMTNIKVQSMIRSIQHERAEENRTRAIRREEYVLKKLTEEVEHGDKASSRIRALELLGKTVAMFSDKEELNTKKIERSPDEIKEDLKLKLQKLLPCQIITTT